MTTSCDTLNLALSSFNQGLGGVCIETECSVNLYDAKTGKYVYNRWSDKNEKGEDVSNSELQWLQSKARQYLNRIGIYYDQSPYTNNINLLLAAFNGNN